MHFIQSVYLAYGYLDCYFKLIKRHSRKIEAGKERVRERKKERKTEKKSKKKKK